MKQKVKDTLCRVSLFVFSLVALSNSSLGKTITPQDSTAEVIEIRIDPASADGGERAMLFDSIVYVPLETTKDAELSNISQLEVTDHYYIILDQRLNTIFFFDRDGSFSHKIDKDNEHKAFGGLNGFTVDRSAGTLSFDDNTSPYTHIYGLDGEFIEAMERNFDVSFRNVALFNGFKIGYFPQYTHDKHDGRAHFDGIVVYDVATDQSLGSYLPIDTVRKNPYTLGGGGFYHSGGGRLLFAQHYDYTIYEFGSDGVPHEGYKIVLPLANTVPPDFLTNPTYRSKWMDYLRADRSLIYSIRDVYVSGDWLTFNLFPSTKGGTFLYNLATYELFNLRETVDSSFGLPVAGMSNPVIGLDNGALISAENFLNLKKLYEETPRAERKEMFPPHLLDLMNNESHNPMLRLSYLKQDY